MGLFARSCEAPVAAFRMFVMFAAATLADAQEIDAAKLFLEAAKVFQHPRCTNCHASGDSPRQGEDKRIHQPPVTRGPNDQGANGMFCNVCHQDKNLAGIPGASHWQLAPKSMGWGEVTAAEICKRLNDPVSNGNRKAKGIALHVAHDALVIWAWNPGGNRTSPPISHDQFVDLLTRWAEAGGGCPK